MCEQQSPEEAALSLIEAIRASDLNTISQRLHGGVDVNSTTARGFPIMQYANNEQVLRLLVQYGANLNLRDARGMAWLHYAALIDYDMTEMLLRHGADPNAVDSNGESPLFCAVHARRCDIARLLLHQRADPNLSNEDSGWTPLHLAIICGCQDIARLLLESGADVDPRAKNGETPLMAAADMDVVWGTDTVSLLLLHGADVNAARDKGIRALHCAAAHGNERLMQQLLDWGADPTAKTSSGLTADDMLVWSKESARG